MKKNVPYCKMKIILSPKYKNFCLFESVAINGVGCTSLIFQDFLRDNIAYPGLYEFWFNPPIPQTETEYLMTFMIASWLATAGSLQAFINFDNLVPKKTKLASLYTFFICDLIWIYLMLEYTKYFSIYHIIGSIYTIFTRGQFVINPDTIFMNSTLTYYDYDKVQ